jgi:putative toxin-antitoxin system antitoxin component (TIGR02293 family)
MGAAQKIVDVLGGPRVIGRSVSTLDDLAKRLRKGLPYTSVECMMDTLGISREVLASTLQIPPRTLARRKREGALGPGESDRLYRLARVVAHALAVFEDDKKVAAWMNRPSRALLGRFPMEVLDTDIGVQQVDDILGRIEYGVYS